jgi:L-fucose mutarotase
MLKGISKLISPELIKILMEMGHGDEIVIADGNFPAASHAARLVRADGHDIPELLAAILHLLPLDTYGDHPVSLMAVAAGDPVETPIWEVYQSIVDASEQRSISLEQIERFVFYERAKKAYAVVATGEAALYANIILRKGVIT